MSSGNLNYMGSAGASSTEATVQQIVGLTTTYSSMSCFIATTSGSNTVFTLNVNTVSQNLSCTIPAGLNFGTTTPGSTTITVDAGQLVDVQVVITGAATPGSVALGP